MSKAIHSEKIIFVAGPTASGKSDAAVSLAENIGGEIISCDSMQIYREISIASNKPAEDALKNVAHHLVGILSIEEEFDVVRFSRLAQDAIEGIRNRGHIPIVAGGSGMYMQILLDGIFESGSRNEALRKDLRVQARQQGNQFLYDKLKTEDPQAAVKIHPNDVRRVIRALEVCIIEQKPISKLQQKRQGLWGRMPILPVVLSREREDLYSRINQRVDGMIRAGLVDEIERLHGANWSRTACKIIGVVEIMAYLKKKCSLEDAVERMKINTRHLAKRQLTWFRRDKRFEWLALTSEHTPAEIAQLVIRKWDG